MAITAGCRQAAEDVAIDNCRRLEEVVTCGPVSPMPMFRPLPPPKAPSGVRIYIDRSGSMSGYLDRGFNDAFGVKPGSSSFRTIIDRVLAAGSAAQRRVYSFGAKVRLVTAPPGVDVIRTLVDQQFYNDNDTRLEEVLDSISTDTNHSLLHLVVTDGRRGGGAAAIAQYRRIGELARQWSDDPRGLFALAAFSAPFTPVSADKAGCWNGYAKGRQAESHCPLYVIAFAPRQAAAEVLDRIRNAGGHLFTAPTLSDNQSVLVIKPAMYVMGGGRIGAPLRAFYTAAAGTKETGIASVDAELNADFGSSASRFALGDSLSWRLLSASVTTNPPKARWPAVSDTKSSWVSPGMPHTDAPRSKVTLPVKLRSRPGVPPTAYYLELVSSGKPGWLGGFEASKQGDSTLTFGLSTLFAQLAPTASPIAACTITVY